MPKPRAWWLARKRGCGGFICGGLSVTGATAAGVSPLDGGQARPCRWITPPGPATYGGCAFCRCAAGCRRSWQNRVSISECANVTYPRKTTASLAADYIFVAACLAFAALVLALFFLVFALGDLRLSRTDPIAAEVVDKTTQTQLVSSKRGVPKTRLVNWVELQVTQSSGQVTRFGLGPDAETYANLRLGQKVLVRFNPSNPLSSVLHSAFRAGKPGLATRLLAVGAAMAMIGSAVLIMWGGAQARRLIRTRDQGFERRAVVIV